MHMHWIEKVIECESIYFCLNMWIYLWVELQPVGKEKWLDVSGLSASSVLYPKGSTSSWKDGEELTRGNFSLYSTHLTLFYCSSHQSFSKNTLQDTTNCFACQLRVPMFPILFPCVPTVFSRCGCDHSVQCNIIRLFVHIDGLTAGGGRNARSGYPPLRSHLHGGYGSMCLTELHNKMLCKVLPRLTFAAILNVCLM